MDQIICIDDRYYIPAASTLADDRTRVLKQGETFALFDRYGDIQPIGRGWQGLYHEGTRFLSQLEVRLGRDRPILLSSSVKKNNAMLAVDLTNPDMWTKDGTIAVACGSLHVFRALFLWEGACYERLRIANYGLEPVEVGLTFRFNADFADIFEVRGTKRERRGQRMNELVRPDNVQLVYLGLDGITRRTRIDASPEPQRISSSEIFYDVRLAPKEEASYFLTVSCESGDQVSAAPSYDQAFFLAEQALRVARGRECEIETSNGQFNDWLNRSQTDLQMMITETASGSYPYAGVPWFSTAFGRDGLITALEYLWINPDLARGVLRYLAAMQATEAAPERDAEPGKILHETRKGEMANLGEIPFKCYYGSVDSTPLFVMLAGAHYEQTGDAAFVKQLWPHVEAALDWIDAYGDADGDGFVEYARHSRNGLVHQGWKDSRDAVFHADGSLAAGPIALCEVQAYVYAAKRHAATFARLVGHAERAKELLRQAEALQRRFEEAFWCEEIGTYAVALDGDKRMCKVRTSNAGHCLLTGIASPEHARRVAQGLVEKEFFSGWGVRTVGSAERRYNPMSYHNGSIWPHDNALVAMGMARYGFKQEALRILSGLFDASRFLDFQRLPELFCGFVRRPAEGPSLYPVACSPQAWAVASVFMVLQACLGIEIDGLEGRITFSNPQLPDFLQEVLLRNLAVGNGSVDLLLQRHAQYVSISILRKEGPVELVVKK
jgi:glycogen debranching enzyme